MNVAISDRKTILYFSDVNSYSRAHARLRALADIGHTVFCLPSQPIVTSDLDYIKKGPIGKVIERVAPTWVSRGLVKSLAALLSEIQPDMFWADKPSMLGRRATRYLRNQSHDTKFVLFTEDDLWMPHNRSKALEEALPEYDFVFTTKRRNILNGELEQLGARRVVFVKQAFDPYQHFPQPVGTNDREAYGGAIGFVGNFESQRATSISRLAESGLEVRVWGNGWHKLTNTKVRVEGVPVFNSTRGLFYSRTISATGINLGFLRHRNRDSHTSRTFEIPACGGFLLAEYSEEHESLFLPDVEAVFFSSDDELIEKANFYNKNADVRARIAQAGFKRCLNDYTSVAQMRRSLEAIDAS